MIEGEDARVARELVHALDFRAQTIAHEIMIGRKR